MGNTQEFEYVKAGIIGDDKGVNVVVDNVNTMVTAYGGKLHAANVVKRNWAIEASYLYRFPRGLKTDAMFQEENLSVLTRGVESWCGVALQKVSAPALRPA